jgi:hypothetical protein
VEGCESIGSRGRGEEVFARARVRGDVDPHCSGSGARETDGGAIVIEVRASALFECLGGWIDVSCLAVRPYVKQAEEVSADSLGGRRDCREEEELALVVVVLIVVELLLNGGIQSSVEVASLALSHALSGAATSIRKGDKAPFAFDVGVPQRPVWFWA